MIDTLLTLPGRLLTQQETRSDRVALREKTFGVWREFTWNDYARGVSEVAASMMLSGIQAGEHIAILSENRTEWLFADLGAQSLGVRSVGIYQTNPVEDVAYVVEHCQAKIVFCEDQEQVDKLLDSRVTIPTLETIVVFDPRGLRRIDDDRLTTWTDFLERGVVYVKKHPEWWPTLVKALDPMSRRWSFIHRVQQVSLKGRCYLGEMLLGLLKR